MILGGFECSLVPNLSLDHVPLGRTLRPRALNGGSQGTFQVLTSTPGVQSPVRIIFLGQYPAAAAAVGVETQRTAPAIAALPPPLRTWGHTAGMSYLLNPATGPLATAVLYLGPRWQQHGGCARKLRPQYFFYYPPRPQVADGTKKFPCRGALHPWDKRVSVREFQQLGGVVVHTGSMHAMAVWGTPLGVCTQGGYACSPTPVCPCHLNTVLLYLPMFSPQASQYTPEGACHTSWTASAKPLIQQCCVLPSPKKP